MFDLITNVCMTLPFINVQSTFNEVIFTKFRLAVGLHYAVKWSD